MWMLGVAVLCLALPEVAVIESGYVDVEGGRVFYEAAGRGPAVVLAHDGLLHRETWENQFPAYAGRHRVIRYDRRGYGRSDPPRVPFSNQEDLHALLKALKVERATLIGCSYGGLLSIDYALAHPEMVSGLVLAGPIVSAYGFSDHFRGRGGRGTPSPDATVEQKIEYWTGTDPWLLAPESTAARARARQLLAANPQNLSVQWDLLRRPRSVALGRLAEIKVPVLIVVGESDIPDVHAHTGVIEAGIAGSRRVVLPHSGHLAHLEAPDAFNHVVLEFLGGIKP